MAILLMNLRGVPEDEAEQVRALLRERGIEFFETPPSRWLVSAGAIWLSDDEDAERARELLADYQQRRQANARADYQRQRREGTFEGLGSRLRREPLRLLLYLAGAAAVLYLSVVPFLELGG